MGADDEGQFDVGGFAGAGEEGGAGGEGFSSLLQGLLMLGEVVEEVVFGDEDDDLLGEGEGEALLEILEG